MNRHLAPNRTIYTERFGRFVPIKGNVGLMKAVERFQPAKGAKLSTYAGWWIKQSIKRALEKRKHSSRSPNIRGESAKSRSRRWFDARKATSPFSRFYKDRFRWLASRRLRVY